MRLCDGTAIWYIFDDVIFVQLFFNSFWRRLDFFCKKNPFFPIITSERRYCNLIILIYYGVREREKISVLRNKIKHYWYISHVGSVDSWLSNDQIVRVCNVHSPQNSQKAFKTINQISGACNVKIVGFDQTSLILVDCHCNIHTVRSLWPGMYGSK